jgi:ribbon-helix-helix CopG family protein
MSVKKIIQVPAEPELIEALDKVAKERGVPRAEVIRDACNKMLRRLKDEELDRITAEGYRRIPEEQGDGEAYAMAAAEPWSMRSGRCNEVSCGGRTSRHLLAYGLHCF